MKVKRLSIWVWLKTLQFTKHLLDIFRRPPFLKVSSKVGNFKKINYATFKCDLEFELNNAGINPNSTVNDLVETFQNASTKVLNTHAPVTTRSWYNDNIRAQKQGQWRAIQA